MEDEVIEGEAAGAASSTEPTAQNFEKQRRSTRVVHSVPIAVTGTNALKEEFREETSTITVDCYGCKFASKNYAPKDSTIIIEIRQAAPGRVARTVRGRVAWLQRPRTYRESYQVAIELEVPGNVWGIASPPADWFAPPYDLKIAEAPPRTDEADATASKPKLAAETAVEQPRVAEAIEVTFTREQLDGHIREAIARAVRTIAERVSEAAIQDIVSQTARRAATILEEARNLSRAEAEELDGKIRRLLDEAVSKCQTRQADSALSERSPSEPDWPIHE